MEGREENRLSWGGREEGEGGKVRAVRTEKRWERAGQRRKGGREGVGGRVEKGREGD